MPDPAKRLVLNGAYGKIEVSRERERATKYTYLFERYKEGSKDRYVMACNLREAVYVRQLSKTPLEGVIRCHGASVTDEGMLASTMELGDCTLYDYMMSYPFEHRLEVFDAVFKQITVGLVNMHRSGAIHGDLKTNNILRTSVMPPTFKIIDFGGLSWTGVAQQHTSLCTYVTRAPELFEDGARPTEIADAWSLGATMLNFLTRKFIIDDSAKCNVTAQLREKYAKGIRVRIPSAVPPEMRTMLDGLLQMDPELRWSCERVLTEYFRFFDAGPVPRAIKHDSMTARSAPGSRADLVRRVRAMVAEREEWDAVPLVVSYIRRTYDDWTSVPMTQFTDDLTAAYVLARAIVYDADTNMIKITDAVRDRIVYMMRALDFDLATPAYVAPIVVSVDGNIAASKSTVIDALRSSGLPIDVVPEPVHEWEPLLRLYYEDPARWATTLHANILASYARIGKKVVRPTVIERSAWTCMHVFQDMLHKDGTVTAEEHKVVSKLAELTDGAMPDVIVYLRCPPDECMRRKAKRARQCESQMDAEYMRRLHAQYEDVLTAETCRRHDIRLIEIDASRPVDRVCVDVVDIVRRLTAES